MIYEYPEDFIVPVVYTEDLDPMYRDLEFKYIKVGEGIVYQEEMQEEEMFHMNEYKTSKNKGMNFLDIDIDIDIDEDEKKDILSEIDDEYVNSEILNR